MLVLSYQFLWIWLSQNSLFLCLQRIKYWLLTALGKEFGCSCNHLQHICTNASAHTCWIWLLRAFSLIIAEQILTTEPLDKWLKKRYNTTTLIGRSCERDCICYSLFVIKNHPLPWGRSHRFGSGFFTTTYTTIDTIGAPGDKMPREREWSFLP